MTTLTNEAAVCVAGLMVLALAAMAHGAGASANPTTSVAPAAPSGADRLRRVYADDANAPADERLGRCRHLNMRFTMPDYPTKAAWEERAAWLREHVRVSSGLLPEPERTELRPEVFGKIQRDGYTIEKAFFESRPGFYVCGNLYRPRGKKGPFPGVASPTTSGL